MPNPLVWDATGEREYGLGVSKCVLYPIDPATGLHEEGVAWNGLTGVDENPDGADLNDIWADNIKYATFSTPENTKGSIKAFMFPDEFYPCLGMAEAASGVTGFVFGGQTRKAFSFCYRTEIGTDTNEHAGYILHIVYNCKVQPSSKSHSTKNENPDPEEMSWDYSATPVNVTGITGVTTCSYVEIKSTEWTDSKMKALEDVLYGTSSAAASLPADPASLYNTLSTAT